MSTLGVYTQIFKLFFLLASIHFILSLICQSHSEAMRSRNKELKKYFNFKIKIEHCFIYTSGFIPFLLLVKLNWIELFISSNILFWSQFFEDNYAPVYFWKKIYKKSWRNIKNQKELKFINIKNFLKQKLFDFILKPFSKLFMILMNQVIHLSFLFPIIYFILN